MVVQKNLIWLAYASLFLLGLSDNIRGPLYPEILKEFSLTNAQGSLFFALASGTIIPAGYLSSFFLNKLGRLNTLRFSILILTLGILGVAFLPEYNLILVAVIIYGFSLGMMGVVQNVMVIEASPPEQLQKWQSGLHSMYGLASLSAPLIVMMLYQWRPDWRTAFYFSAGLALLVLLTTFFIQDSGHNHLQTENLNPQTNASGFQKIFFSMIIATYVASEILVGTRLAQFSREYFQFSFSEAAQMTTLFFVMLFVGRFLFIFWRPKVSLKGQMLISLGSAAICVVFGLLVHPFGLALSGLAMAPFYPMAMTLAGKLFPQELHRVTSLAVALSGATLMIAQLVVGALSDRFGLQTALFIGPMFSVIALYQIFQYKKLFNREIL